MALGSGILAGTTGCAIRGGRWGGRGGGAWLVLGAPVWLRGAVLALGSGILPERRAAR